MQVECAVCQNTTQDNYCTIKSCGHVFHNCCLQQDQNSRVLTGLIDGTHQRYYECPICRCKYTSVSNDVMRLYLNETEVQEIEEPEDPIVLSTLEILKKKNITKEDILEYMQEIGFTHDDTEVPYYCLPAKRKLAKLVGLYSIKNENLNEFNFTGIKELVYEDIKKAFEMGRFISKYGTDIHPSMIEWTNGIMIIPEVTTNTAA